MTPCHVTSSVGMWGDVPLACSRNELSTIGIEDAQRCSRAYFTGEQQRVPYFPVGILEVHKTIDIHEEGIGRFVNTVTVALTLAAVDPYG